MELDRFDRAGIIRGGWVTRAAHTAGARIHS